jgi:hypothetical protein
MTSVDLRLRYQADSGRCPASYQYDLFRQIEGYDDRLEAYIVWLETELIKLLNIKES